MPPDESTSAETDLKARMRIAAHHEAGHIVLAGAVGLCLRSEGVMIDTAANGVACYCKEPEDSDVSRERVMIATFAGCFAQDYFCRENSLPTLQYLAIIWSQDWKEARGISGKLSDTYLAGQTISTVQDSLEEQSKQLVARHWDAIEAIADAVLAQEWEEVKPFPSGGKWSDQSMVKCISGDRIVDILKEFDIVADCASGC